MKKASEVRREDFDRLRALGFTERQISDIASCGSLPSFICRRRVPAGADGRKDCEAQPFTPARKLRVEGASTSRS